MSEEKFCWTGALPKDCDLCHKPLQEVFIDGVLKTGKTFPKWAIMCRSCHERFGSGLGRGKGQIYDLRSKQLVKSY